MTRGRWLRAFGAALVAAVGLVPAAAAGATPASGSKTICVGLVIDDRSIGGSVSAKCVTVKRGTTGVGVLEAAGHALTFRSDGVMCTIDGVPTSGCSHIDDSHYWAYYQRAPDRTAWSYSSEGPATYEPANRATEGWVYDDGTSLKPDNVPAAKICAALLIPMPKTGVTATHRARVTPTPTPTPETPHATRSGSRQGSPTSRPTTATPTASGTPSQSAAPEVAAATSSKGRGNAAGGHGNAAGALIAAAVIAVLLGAAVVTARRRR